MQGAVGTFVVDGIGSALVGRVMSHSDLEYAIAAYYRRHGEWPSSISQLRAFVDGSNGYLILSDTSDYSFTELGEQLLVQSASSTNGLRFTLKPARALTGERERSPFYSLFGIGHPAETADNLSH